MNQIDKIFRNRLEHHTTDVPAGAWESISARLDAEATQPKRPILLFMGIFVLFIFGTMATYYYLNSASTASTPSASGTSEAPHATVVTPDHGSQPVLFSDNSINNTPSQAAVPASDNSNSVNVTSAVSQNAVAGLAGLSQSMPVAVLNEAFTDSESLIIPSESVEGTMARENIEVAELNTPSVRKLRFFREFKFMALPSKEKQAAACPFKSTINDKSVDVYVSHDYGHRSLIATDASYEDHIENRTQTETPVYSFSAGLRFGYNVGYRWNLYTGFNYSQINEKFEYIDPESNQIRIITIKDYIYENGKIVDSVVTEKKVVVSGTTKVKVFNKYRSFDLPVLARYTLYADRNLSLSAVGGVYINLAFSEKGMMLSKDDVVPVEFTSQDTDPKGIFRSQAGVTPYTALSLAYHLTGNIDLLLEPNARFQTRSLTSDQYPVSQKFNTYGISTGLRYKF